MFSCPNVLRPERRPADPSTTRGERSPDNAGDFAAQDDCIILRRRVGMFAPARRRSRSADQFSLRGTDDVRYLVARIHGSAGIVDHVVDAAVGCQVDGQDVVQLHSGGHGDFEGACSMDIRAYVEEAIAAHTPSILRVAGVTHLSDGYYVSAVL